MGDWSITLGERPLNANMFVRFFLGDHVSHSCVRIKDDNQKTVLELHGLYSSGRGAFFNTMARVLTGRPNHSCKLHVLALTGERLMRIFTAHSAVTDTPEMTGSEDSVLRATECMLRTARVINRDRLDYFFDLKGGGQCCHSVAAELLRRVGIDMTQQDLPFDTPGRKTNLEDVDPTLRKIGINRRAPLAAIKKVIAREVAGFSPDARMSLWLNGTATPLAAMVPR